MNSIAIVNPNILNPDNKLYSLLSSDKAPIWWNLLKQDPELYIEIRKNDVVEIYYQGGRMAKLEFDKKSKKITPTAHPSYLGHSDRTDTRYYKNDKDHSAIYQDCSEWLCHKLDDMKKNIRKSYTDNHESKENVSEKKIQGHLIVSRRDKYIDSEFEYRFREGERKEIRIDLVKIDNNQIIFEELKKINDYRMHTSKEENPEIVKQMREYKEFILKNQVTLLEYYRALIKIKEFLGLPIPNINNDSLVVNPEPVLLIANNYEKINGQRDNRLNHIEGILKSNGIKYKLFNY